MYPSRKVCVAMMAIALTLLPATMGCGIWGQLFCDYCWDGQYTAGTDSYIAKAQVSANCTVTTSGGKTVYYWGTDTSTDSNGNFQAAITGTSNLLGTGSAEASFLKGLFVGSNFLLGQIAGTGVVGCQISVSNTGSCSVLSYNDGTFLTTGAKGNGWSSSQVSIQQYMSSTLADIYVSPGKSNANSVSCTPPTRGQGASKSCPAAAPPPPGSKGDPHFTGADSSHYDFTGQPGNSYCLVADRHLHINALYGGRYGQWGSNANKAMTWMREVAVLWGAHSVVLRARQGARWQYDTGYMAAIEVDGRPVTALLRQAGDSLSLLDGQLEITWLAARLASGDDLVDVYSVRISDLLLLRLTLRPEVPLLRTLDDGVVHFNLEFPTLQLSAAKAHGVLGQTFRSDHRLRLGKQRLQYSELLQTEVIPGDNAEGFLDGSEDDYRTSSLLAPDCKFATFQGLTTVDTEATGTQLTTSTASSVLLNRKFLIVKTDA